MRTRSERRHNDWKKAIRKKRISESRHVSPDVTWYDNLHQYSKNKIHCSCPMCRGKIKNKHIAGPAEVWPIRDQRQFVDMEQQRESETEVTE